VNAESALTHDGSDAPLANRRLNPSTPNKTGPAMSREALELVRHPVLASLCWFRRDAAIPEKEAYTLYVDNWEFVDQIAMPAEERATVIALNARYGNLLRIYTPSPAS
jgi:hypothetical protein